MAETHMGLATSSYLQVTCQRVVMIKERHVPSARVEAIDISQPHERWCKGEAEAHCVVAAPVQQVEVVIIHQIGCIKDPLRRSWKRA